MTPENDDTIIEPLRGNVADNWLRTAGKGLFYAFETGKAALDYFRSNMGQIRTSVFYEIRREVLSEQSFIGDIAKLGQYDLIPKAWHNAEHGLNLSAGYEYRVHAYGYDPSSGMMKDRWMTIASDRQLSKADVFSVATMYSQEGQYSDEIVIETFGEVEAMVRA